MITPHKRPRLGVNIDHIATLRNARGGNAPDPLTWAQKAVAAGADIITFHLREDRRHIRDTDVQRLKEALQVPLNFEAAATLEMLDIIRKIQPHSVCLVPEKRAELTTEGGLDVVKHAETLQPFITHLREASIQVSLFIDAHIHHIEVAKFLGADAVELHTGNYANAAETQTQHDELEKIKQGALLADKLGLQVNAGHGLNLDNVNQIARINVIAELHIGHALIAHSLLVGVQQAVTDFLRNC